jgi:small subunit ribosomal protein S8
MVNDTVADLLTRIRNAIQARHKTVVAPKAKQSLAVLDVLKAEGFINGYEDVVEAKFPEIEISLKYFESGEPLMHQIKRVSTPGQRIYRGKDALPKVGSGLGISLISTSQGLMTDREARKRGIGGEVVATIV